MTLNERFQRIDALGQRLVRMGSFSGIEWKVTRGGLHWASGRAGQAEALVGRDMAQVPIYRIFSMTKPIISAIALMLIEAGRLKLYHPVARYLPEFGSLRVWQVGGDTVPAQSAVTIEHLMSHRAGLSYGFLPDCPVAPLYRQSDLHNPAVSLGDYVGRIATLPLAFEPGTGWQYSVATDVLARVLEIILGDTIQAIVARYITIPLGMKDTDYMVAPDKRHRIMAIYGHSTLDDVMQIRGGAQKLTASSVAGECPADNPDYGRGGVGLFSTLADYHVLAEMLRTGLAQGGNRLLSRAALRLMWSNRLPATLLPLKIGAINLPGYGFGLAGRVMLDLGQAQSLGAVGECGWAGAASTYFWIDRDREMTGVVMAQYLGSAIPIGEEFKDAVYQAFD